MGTNNSIERGSASVEYGLTIGAVALLAAAMFANSSNNINGVWKQATATSNRSSSAATASAQAIHIQRAQCLAGAHGDSKTCAIEDH